MTAPPKKTAAKKTAAKKTAAKKTAAKKTAAKKTAAKKTAAKKTAAKKTAAKKAPAKRPPLPPVPPGTVRLLSGGNPQIAKGDGDGPVQAYIAALPGWKSAMGRRLDALVTEAAPQAQKAVKWNSPMYSVEGQGFFLGLHAFTGYLKLTFFRGAALKPLPPGASKVEGTRSLDIHEDDTLDEAQLTAWVKQAAALPGVVL